MADLNLKLATLAPALDTDRPSEVIEKVILEKSSGIRLMSFSWIEKEGKHSLTVSGVASDRQALLAFQTQLNSAEEFSKITLPVSDLAKDKNIPFRMNLVPLGYHVAQ